MTIKDLKEIVSILPDNAIVFVEDSKVSEIESTSIVLFSDGRKRLIFSALS